jgi:hypothetical protein
METVKVYYKGKGNHSVNELEKMIEQREEEISKLRNEQFYPILEALKELLYVEELDEVGQHKAEIKAMKAIKQAEQ